MVRSEKLLRRCTHGIKEFSSRAYQPPDSLFAFAVSSSPTGTLLVLIVCCRVAQDSRGDSLWYKLSGTWDRRGYPNTSQRPIDLHSLLGPSPSRRCEDSPASLNIATPSVTRTCFVVRLTDQSADWKGHEIEKRFKFTKLVSLSGKYGLV
jgi:hypothetical protein